MSDKYQHGRPALADNASAERPGGPFCSGIAVLTQPNCTSHLTIDEILAALGPRAYLLLVVLVITPFMTPVPSMGLSSPAGAIVVVVGLSLMLDRQLWLPGVVRRRQFARATVIRALEAADGLIRRLSRFLQPRMRYAVEGRMKVAIGFSLVVAGIVLGLPLPIPLSNAIPAVAIMLLCLGLMFKDGLAVIAGHAACGINCVLLVLLADIALALATNLWQRL